MKFEATRTETNDDLIVRSTQAKSHSTHFLTATIEDPLVAFSKMAAFAAEKRVEIFQEKVYGLSAAREEILAARTAEYSRCGLDASLPVTFIHGAPVSGAKFAGVQVWGVGPGQEGEASVTTLERVGFTPGRCWTGPGFRMVYLPHLTGADSDGRLACCPTGQAQRMFANAVEGLETQGFAYTDVVRTWIYLSRILDWYGEFNRVRTELHMKEGLVLDGDDSVFPASTGIQGKQDEEECFMDLLAVASSGSVDIEPILGSKRQPPAFSYGSGFSRGMALTIEGRKIVFISGTASTNAAGETIHINDPEAQCVETLLSIAAILEEQGGSLDDICMSTFFCKDAEFYKAYRNVNRLLGLKEFPTVPVVADVCRHDWLVEIEAVAVI